jgi:hypothetical protein
MLLMKLSTNQAVRQRYGGKFLSMSPRNSEVTIIVHHLYGNI